MNKFLEPSPITGSYWDDARGPVGFLGAAAKQVLERAPKKQHGISKSIDRMHDICCAFAALTKLAHTGQAGLDISKLYERSTEAARKFTPYMDEVFRREYANWRHYIEPRDDPCWYCRMSSAGQPCDVCLGSGKIRFVGLEDHADRQTRAVRIAFVAHRLINKFTTTPQPSAVFLRNMTDIFDAGVVEAQKAGLSERYLMDLEYSWRFYAIARRQPTHVNEQLFLAFQAAWEAGQYDFARQMVRTNVTSP